MFTVPKALAAPPPRGELGLNTTAARMRGSRNFWPPSGKVSPLTASVVTAPNEWPDIPTFFKSNRPASAWVWSAFHASSWLSTAGTSCTRSRKLSSEAALFSAPMRSAAGVSFQTESSLPGCCRNTAT